LTQNLDAIFISLFLAAVDFLRFLYRFSYYLSALIDDFNQRLVHVTRKNEDENDKVNDLCEKHGPLNAEGMEKISHDSEEKNKKGLDELHDERDDEAVNSDGFG